MSKSTRKLPESERLSVRITSCVTPEEADYIRRCAEASEVSVSEFIHEVLLGFRY